MCSSRREAIEYGKSQEYLMHCRIQSSLRGKAMLDTLGTLLAAVVAALSLVGAIWFFLFKTLPSRSSITNRQSLLPRALAIVTALMVAISFVSYLLPRVGSRLQQSWRQISFDVRPVATGVFAVWTLIVLLLVASTWKVFVKAGEPGWAAVVPIYNLLILLKIAGKPAWWLVLLLIPIVNIPILLLTFISLAERFGKGAGFGVGLLFLAPVFYPLLAWGDAHYVSKRGWNHSA